MSDEWNSFARTEAAVKDIFPKKSPLVQVGRKIFIEISVTWEDLSKIDKMKTRLGTVKKKNYIIENKDILKEIGVDLKEKVDKSKTHFSTIAVLKF